MNPVTKSYVEKNPADESYVDMKPGTESYVETNIGADFYDKINIETKKLILLSSDLSVWAVVKSYFEVSGPNRLRVIIGVAVKGNDSR